MNQQRLRCFRPPSSIRARCDGQGADAAPGSIGENMAGAGSASWGSAALESAPDSGSTGLRHKRRGFRRRRCCNIVVPGKSVPAEDSEGTAHRRLKIIGKITSGPVHSPGVLRAPPSSSFHRFRHDRRRDCGAGGSATLDCGAATVAPSSSSPRTSKIARQIVFGQLQLSRRACPDRADICSDSEGR